ncbi:MAG: hypothetical protein R6T93_13500 [Trueperaceae bacterium]
MIHPAPGEARKTTAAGVELPLDVPTKRDPVADLVGDHGVDVGVRQVAPGDPTGAPRRVDLARQVSGTFQAASDETRLAALEAVVQGEHLVTVHASSVT